MSLRVRRGYVDASHGQLHYRTTGSGEPLLLLAPTPRSSLYYVDLMEHLDGFQAFALDTPGFGMSDALPSGYTLTDVAGAVVETLDCLSLERVHIVGVHAGNKIGAEVAARWPARVRSFVFAGMTHSIILDNIARRAAMQAFRSMMMPAAAEDLLTLLEFDPPDRGDHTLDSFCDAGQECELMHHQTGCLRHRRRLLGRVVDQALGFENVDHLYAANYGQDLEATLRDIQAPTLVVEMRAPIDSHLSPQADILAAVIPSAQSITVEGSDRELLADRATEIADIIGSQLSLHG